MSEDHSATLTARPHSAITSVPDVTTDDVDSSHVVTNIPVEDRGVVYRGVETDGGGTEGMGSLNTAQQYQSDLSDSARKEHEAQWNKEETRTENHHEIDDSADALLPSNNIITTATTKDNNNDNTGNSNKDTVSKNSSEGGEASSKDTVWQTGCGGEGSVAEGSSDQPAGCVNAGAGDTTHRPSPLPGTNNSIRDPRSQHRGQALSEQGITDKAFCLAARQDNGITHPHHPCVREGCSPPQFTDTHRAEGSTLCCHSALSSADRRRPASARESQRTEGLLLDSQVSSQDLLTPVSGAGSRRLSLPLDLRLRDCKETSLRVRDSEHVNTPPDPAESLLDAVVAEVEKETRRAVFVTYSEEEHTKDPDVPSPVPLSQNKPPPPSSPARARPKPRPRPQTAGAASASAASAAGGGGGRGGRASDRRMIHSAPARTALLQRPWETGFSKEELQRALPRRNFFSCHNKALKEAGFEVEEENTRPRRRRLVFFRHDEDPEEKPPAAPAAPPTIRVPQASEDKEGGHDATTTRSRGHDTTTTSTTTTPAQLENSLETAVQMLSITERAKRRKSQLPQVECKPLQLYLGHVAEKPGEYRHMLAKSCTSGPAAALHPSSHAADNCHTARLVSMGRVFQEKHGGGGAARHTDEVLRAAYSLNPREADPFRFARPSRDKSAMVAGMASRKQSTLPNFSRKESSAVSTHSGEEGGGKCGGQRSKPGSEMMPRHEAEKLVLMEKLTELERLKLKAEEWARCVTTEQLVRAKLQVLKELGHEEQEMTQWWLAFRACSYLRTRIRE